MHSTPGPRLGTPPPAADARRELDAVHGRLLELLPSAVLLIALDGRITFANAEAERLFASRGRGAEHVRPRAVTRPG